MANNLPEKSKPKYTLQDALQRPDLIKRIEDRLGNKSGTFITTILDLVNTSSRLQECNPMDVITESLKAASLDLPINSNLGFAYLIPYKEKGIMKPHFQCGYKGFLQLAIRTGQYKHLNAGVVYEGEKMVDDRIRGTLTIEGKAISDKPIGYFAYMELINGFEKAIGWSAEQVIAHAGRYSKSYSDKSTPWHTNTEAMCKKTMLLQLIPKYGPMTIEMSTALANDRSDFAGFSYQKEIEENANSGEIIDIEPQQEPPADEPSDEEKAAIEQMEIDESRRQVASHGKCAF